MATRAEAVFDAREVDESQLAGRTVLFRDREGLCPHAQRVWLALEIKRADYVTCLVGDDDGTWRATPAGLFLPRIRWADGTSNDGVSEMDAILARIEGEHPHAPHFFPKVSVSISDLIRDSFRRFDGVLPRFTRASSVAPYIFPVKIQRAGSWKLELAKEGEIVPGYKYEVALEEIEEILGEYEDGPFVAGTGPTAADIFIAPFLERLAAHLPLLYPDGGYEGRFERFEAVQQFLCAMDELVPSQSCRVKGRAATWQRLLRERHPELALCAEPKPVPDLPGGDLDAQRVWASYARDRPHLAATPTEEAAARIVRHRARLTAGAAEACALPPADADVALREVCAALAHTKDAARADAAQLLSDEALGVACYLDAGGGLEVPRDLGVVPAEALRALTSRVLVERSET